MGGNLIKIIKWKSKHKIYAINMDLMKSFTIYYQDKEVADGPVLFIHFVDINHNPKEFLYKLNEKTIIESIYDFLNNLIFDFLNDSEQYVLDLTVELEKWEDCNKIDK